MDPALHRKAFALSCFTLGFNALECLASITVAISVGSNALMGFGLDSFIESFSGAVMVWRFGKKHTDNEAAEKKAIRLVAVAFLIVGLYVLCDSARSLYWQERPSASILCIIIAFASLTVMLVLFVAKYRLGKALGSESLVADSKQSLACAWLSVAVLIGVTLNYLRGWWWADSIAGIVIAALLLREGYATFKMGRTCC